MGVMSMLRVQLPVSSFFFFFFFAHKKNYRGIKSLLWDNLVSS